MDKQDIRKLVFLAYNLSSQDQELRSNESLSEWFEEVYSPRDSNEFELARILRVVCEVNEVEIAAVKGRRRFDNLITAKREYGYLARKLTNKSLAEIGKEINRDHANVLHHNKKVINWLGIKGYYLKEKLEMIEGKL